MHKPMIGIAACLVLASAHLSCTSLQDILWDEREIDDFSFAAADNGGRFPDAAGTIDGETITIRVPEGTALTNLVASFAYRGHEIRVAGVRQTSGLHANDFSQALEYCVVAENGEVRVYRVTVGFTAPLSPSNELLSFAFPQALHPALPADAPGEIAGTNVTVGVSFDVDPTALVAAFTTSGVRVEVGSVVQTSAVTTNDFSTPLAYHVVAADGTRRVYRIALNRREFSGGSGTPADPYLIGSAAEMDRVRHHPAAHFRQIADISLAVFTNWVPIGTGLGDPFVGGFDGAGYAISGLTIQRPLSNFQGMFGYMDGALVRDVTLTGVAINGRHHTGGLAGRITNQTVISGCASSGTVTGTNDVGGLVGRCEHSQILHSSSSAAVSGSWYVGGLVGRTDHAALLAFAFSTGTVTGSGYAHGGLTGMAHNTTLISNCYSHSAVFGRYAAGLVGTMDFAAEAIACFSTGAITGPDANRSGLVFQKTPSAIVSHSYWDTETSGRPTSAGGSGKTTAEMYQQATYTGWDFSTVWTINEGLGYPMLR